MAEAEQKPLVKTFTTTCTHVVVMIGSKGFGIEGIPELKETFQFDEIKYLDMLGFLGKQVRVTVEVLP